MSEYLSDEDMAQLQPAANAFASPIPTQMVSNGEFFPAAQTPAQAQVEARIKDAVERLAPRHGQDRRLFLSSAAGMAAAFGAMNAVYGKVFSVDAAEAAEPGAADARAARLSGQFIVDLHTHFLHDAAGPGLQQFADLREKTRIGGLNPRLPGRMATLNDLHLDTYVREMWLDSDTKIAALSGAPSDISEDWMLHNDTIADARDRINRFAGSKRLLSHFIFTPGQPGWLEEIDRGVEMLKPDAWKGYTIGDNTHKATSRYPWRMDDETVTYKAYEKFVKAGVRNVAVHKGLYTLSDEKTYPWLKQYAMVDDVAKAAKDWPQLNFLIYHAGYRYTGKGEYAVALQEFERTGRMEWVSDLADIPRKHGVSNVYADIGASFAACCITEPNTAAAMMGILVKGLGADHIIWGTDSIWFGSPQWQIEAMRRLEIPEAMQTAHGFAPLGAADGPVKTAVFGGNGARLQNLAPARMADDLDGHKARYLAAGGERTNRAYGYVRRA